MRPEAPSEDGRTNAFPADKFVVIARVVDPGHLAVDDAHQGMAIRAAAAELKAAADEGQGDLGAARVLVLDFVGVERGLRIELRGSSRDAGAGLQCLSVHAEDKLATLLRNVGVRRAGAD